jgi:hypothetical protein
MTIRVTDWRSRETPRRGRRYQDAAVPRGELQRGDRLGRKLLGLVDLYTGDLPRALDRLATSTHRTPNSATAGVQSPATRVSATVRSVSPTSATARPSGAQPPGIGDELTENSKPYGAP